jgi:Ulp1 family protease
MAEAYPRPDTLPAVKDDKFNMAKAYPRPDTIPALEDGELRDVLKLLLEGNEETMIRSNYVKFNELEPAKEIGDGIVELYCNCLRDVITRDGKLIWIHDTFFFEQLLPKNGEYNYDNVKERSKRVKKVGARNIFGLELLLIPVFDERHWACVKVDFAQREISYLDSKEWDPKLGGEVRLVKQQQFLLATERYLNDEAERVNQQVVEAERVDQEVVEWRKILPIVPRQDNDKDCGIFCCFFMEYIVKGKVVDFTAIHTKFLRLVIALAVRDGKIKN